MTQQTLAQMVRAKYPGVYDDLSDQQLESSIKAKYPGQYDDVPTTPTPAPVAPPPKPLTPSPWGNEQLRNETRLGIIDQTTRMGAQVGRNVIAPVRDAVGAAWEATKDPIDAAERGAKWAMNLVSGLGQAQAEQLTKAQEAAAKGDYNAAVMHGSAYLLPVVGPMLDDMVARTKAGQSAEVAGDLFTMFVLPSLAKKVPALPGPNMNRLNPVESEAMQYGLNQGLPVTAGQATGNPALTTVSQAADRMTIAGGMAGANRANRMESGLATLGEQLAAKASPRTATLSSSGRSAVTRSQATANARLADATVEYKALRAVEGQDPAKFAVDVQAVKDGIADSYARLLEESKLVPLQGAKADALVIMHRLTNAPNTVSLSQADAALSDLKHIMRRQGRDQFSTGGRDLGEVLSAFEDQVTAAAKADPGAWQALQAGRKATVLRHQALDFVEDIVNRRGTNIAVDAIGRKDSGLELIQQLQRFAPETVSDIGRAFLDDLVDSATATGGFTGAQGLLKTWQRMGPETKRALFADALSRDSGYLKELDNFFLLADKATRNMNPSGSAWAGGTAMHVLQMATLQNPALSAAIEAGGYTASKLLSNPTVVRALSRSAALPLSAKAARAAQVASIYKALDLATAPARAQGAGPVGRQ